MSKRISAAIVLGLVIAIATPSYAGEYKIMSIGTLSCGAFIQQALVKEAALTWMTGYITAVNVTRLAANPDTTTDIDMLRGADVDAVQVWLTNYCNANPMKNIAGAALALAIEMNQAGQ